MADPGGTEPIAPRIDAAAGIPRAEGGDRHEEMKQEKARREENVARGEHEGRAVDGRGQTPDEDEQRRRHRAVPPSKGEGDRAGEAEGQDRPCGAFHERKSGPAHVGRCESDGAAEDRVLDPGPPGSVLYGVIAHARSLSWTTRVRTGG